MRRGIRLAAGFNWFTPGTRPRPSCFPVRLKSSGSTRGAIRRVPVRSTYQNRMLFVHTGSILRRGQGMFMACMWCTTASGNRSKYSKWMPAGRSQNWFGSGASWLLGNLGSIRWWRYPREGWRLRAQGPETFGSGTLKRAGLRSLAVTTRRQMVWRFRRMGGGSMLLAGARRSLLVCRVGGPRLRKRS